ncbi:MAG: hypothetical protein WAU36_03265 [Cyclobacteriaceae bacterium]
MKQLNTFLIILFITSTLLLHVSCEEEPAPIAPCNDNQWATATKNGEEVCLGELAVSYFNPNTANALITFNAGNELTGAREIDAEFSIPTDGIALNTAYPLKSGSLYGADPIRSGTITFLVFDPPAQGKVGCIAGTFSLTAGSPNGPATFEYTNGKFVYNKGTVYEEDNLRDTGCNPFK